MPKEKEELPFETYCDLIERELKIAIQDLTDIRGNKNNAQRTIPMFRAALKGAIHYLRELEKIL